jgi:hypothetical protein
MLSKETNHTHTYQILGAATEAPMDTVESFLPQKVGPMKVLKEFLKDL